MKKESKWKIQKNSSECTGILQPLDTHISKSCKDNFLMNGTIYGIGESNQARKGNVKDPSVSLLTPCIIDSWNEVSSSIILQIIQTLW